jgi:hypothetical protein
MLFMNASIQVEGTGNPRLLILHSQVLELQANPSHGV